MRETLSDFYSLNRYLNPVPTLPSNFAMPLARFLVLNFLIVNRAKSWAKYAGSVGESFVILFIIILFLLLLKRKIVL